MRAKATKEDLRDIEDRGSVKQVVWTLTSAKIPIGGTPITK
jgi:hypothetical protein